MTEQELRTKGKKIIDKCFNGLKNDANECFLMEYWEELFSCELEILKDKAKKNKDLNLLEQNSSTMILTLGTSLEPLVLAIHLINPKTLFVLCTQTSHFDKLKDALEMTQWSGTPKKINLGDHASSASVFKILRNKDDSNIDNENLPELIQLLNNQEERDKMLFDITGAKKSISGGCLLFAAYYEIPIYYMDFGDNPDDYHQDIGKPIPGACFYTKQKNPIAGLCLKDIEAIKEHFDNGRYTIATSSLENIIAKMDKNYFTKEEKENYKKLFLLSRIYMDWNDGWWGDVYDNKDNLPKINQTYVNNLSIYPRKKIINEDNLLATLYKAKGDFLAYLIMEFAIFSRAFYVDKTINARTIFLKIFNIEEVLIGFMCYRLIKLNEIEATFAKQPNNDNKYSLEYCKEEAVTSNYGGLELLLTKQKPEITQKLFPIRLKKPDIKLIFNPIKDPIGKSIRKQLNIFSNNRFLRNKSTHSISSIPENKTEVIIKALRKLIKLIIADNKINWFEGADNIEELKNILQNNDWYKNEKVAPVKWESYFILNS